MNSVNIIGNLTRDVELRYAKEIPIASFTVAVNDGDDADFIPCKVFGKQAENCNMYLKKGSQVAVTGRWKTGNYEKDGQKIYTHECIAQRVKFLDRKPKEDKPQGFDFSDANIPF